MTGRLEGRTAVITGGASGLGRACAERFGEEGANVVIGDLLEARAREVIAAIEASGGRAVFVRTDTTREADNDALADAAVREFGRIDVVVPAAGVAHGTYTTDDAAHDSARFDEWARDPLRGSFIYAPLEEWERVIDINLHGVMLTLRATLRRIVEQGGNASIITIASILAKQPAGIQSAAYSVAKAGVWMLTKSMARELAPLGIRVNAIGPGFFETSMTQAIRDDETRNQMTLQFIPMGRMGDPRELANTALFLASDESSYFTGQILFPDGGFLPGL